LEQHRITYTRDSNSREATKIEFDLPPDMTIEEYHTICVRMAHALGYHHKTVSSIFTEKKSVGNPNQLELLFG